MMKTNSITLSKGQVALVDSDDFEYLSQWKWHMSSAGYAVRSVGGGTRKVLMHRVIMSTPEDLETDHINHNRLDNRRSNLRVCNHSVNMLNRLPYTKKPSAYIRRGGVHFSSKRGKWQVHIQFNKVRKYYGAYDSKEVAQEVANDVRLKLVREI